MSIKANNSPFRLAACSEMIFQDIPFMERLEKIAGRGLEVEMWDWTNKDLDVIAGTGIPISSMTGYVSGNLTDKDEIPNLLESAKRSVEAAHVVGCTRLVIHGTGLGEGGIPVKPVQVVTGAMWAQAALTLNALSKIGRDGDVMFTLENLNLPVDHAGTPFNSPHDTLALVSAVDSPNVRMNLDLYHAQIGDGQLIETCRTSLPWIGEIQIADAPGRCEPGTGEINYRNVALALKDMGYTGVVAMEAFASGDSDQALDTFIETFSV
ncbi:MAG: TIM barrel protein [Ancrocorticia sp.]|uniref:TIM barrel protein n=1 Tax=Ancrocorticia sp. TaxID=2593684 RepID=UPI003F90F967